MSKKLYIDAKVKLILTVDNDADIADEISKLEISLDSDSADISDYEIEKWEITDSK